MSEQILRYLRGGCPPIPRPLKRLGERNRLYGFVGELLARHSLQEDGFEVYSYDEIVWGNLAYMEVVADRLKRRRKKEYIENDKRIIRERETALRRIFGKKFEDMRRYVKALMELQKERETHNHRKRGSISLDLIAWHKGQFTFAEVKVNEGHLTKYQKANMEIAREHGFHTMLFRYRIGVQTSIERSNRSIG